MRSIWTGWDSSVWDLTNADTGVIMVPGVRGWSMPPIEQYRSESPSVAGSQYRGSRVRNRDDVFWPLFLYSDGTDMDWITLDRAFWATMHPDKPGTWSMVRPDGTARSIDLRYESEDPGGDLDPTIIGWNLYAIHLTAEQPFWREDPIVREFRPTVPVPMFSGPGIVQYNSASQLARASINNPGDVPGWVVWTLAGPFESASVGVGGKSISVPFPLGAGEFLTIWTAPENLGETRDGLGRDRTDDLGAAAFVPVQPGSSLPLTLSLISPGVGAYIEASLTPYYYRAW